MRFFILCVFVFLTIFCSAAESSSIASCSFGQNHDDDVTVKLMAGASGPPGPPGQKGEQGAKGENGNTVTSISCLEVLANSDAKGNGIYYIRDSNNISYPVYCDMTINNGGWTLVASIHENNIQGASGRCTSGDKWSNEDGNHRGSQMGAKAWSNYQMFGDVRSATSEDYKNAAYFDLQARDIMIWHVPNDTPLKKFSSASYLQYRTTNGSLSQYDGNLFNLYEKYFPIKSGIFNPVTDSGPAVPVTFDKGNSSLLFELLSDNAKSRVDVGYIQFRPINLERDAFALCPGIRGKRGKVDHTDLEHTCIGSSADNEDYRFCGDFASYSYDEYGTGRGWNVPLKLLTSTYLIFYR